MRMMDSLVKEKEERNKLTAIIEASEKMLTDSINFSKKDFVPAKQDFKTCSIYRL
jgi:hypothetical protein